MHFLKKNITLVLGLALPVLMIIFVAGSIYLPTLFAKAPQYDFVYESGDNSYSGYQKYTIESDGTILTNDAMSPIDKTVPQPAGLMGPKLYLYDVAGNVSRELSPTEIGTIHLNTNMQSPDGFTVINGSNGGGFPFGSNYDYNSHYLSGHNISIKLNTSVPADNYYSYSFRFLGWVK